MDLGWLIAYLYIDRVAISPEKSPNPALSLGLRESIYDIRGLAHLQVPAWPCVFLPRSEGRLK
jgi:hypothetical protein